MKTYNNNKKVINNSDYKYNTERDYSAGFTIVELLVVIVVIGILAAVVTISFSDISIKAAEASLKSDLKNASTTLALYKVNHDIYPSNIDGVLVKSIDTDYQYSIVGDGYCLTATSLRSNAKFFHFSSTNNVIMEGVCAGHVGEGGEEDLIATGWKQVATGSDHTCAIGRDDLAYCWGSNYNKQLGNGDDSVYGSEVPLPVDTSGVLSGKTIKYLAAGGNHTCAIASDDLAYCWGNNWNGVLGNNSSVNSVTPVAIYTSGVLAGKTISMISMSYYTSCVLTSDGFVYCWGYGRDGQLGNGQFNTSYIPVAVYTGGLLNNKIVKSISVGSFHVCATTTDDMSYCWGDGGQGQLGNGLSADRSVATLPVMSGVLSGLTVKSIAASHLSTCIIASNDRVYCWGSNNYGQLGNGLDINSSVPVSVISDGVLSGLQVKSIYSGGGDFFCVIASNDRPYCWGFNGDGRVGNNTNINSLVPAEVDITGVLSGKTISSIAATYHTCALDLDGSLYCWGYNGNGQFGNGTYDNSYVPVAAASFPIEP